MTTMTFRAFFSGFLGWPAALTYRPGSTSATRAFEAAWEDAAMSSFTTLPRREARSADSGRNLPASSFVRVRETISAGAASSVRAVTLRLMSEPTSPTRPTLKPSRDSSSGTCIQYERVVPAASRSAGASSPPALALPATAVWVGRTPPASVRDAGTTWM